MDIQLIMISSIVLQSAASLLALRLVPLTGRRAAWVLISAGLLLMAFRRSITFVNIVTGELTTPLEISAEWVALVTSALMLLGITQIAPLFSSIKSSADALRQSEKKYRTLFEDSKDAVYTTTRNGKFIDMNQAGLDLFGYSREEMTDMDVLGIYAHHEDRARFQEEIERLGAVKDYEVKFVRKDGTPMDCLLTSTLQYSDDGAIVGYRGIMRDVSEQKRMMKLLETERQKFFSLLDALPAFVDLRDRSYTFRFTNRLFRETFGETDETPCYTLFRGRDVPCEPCLAQRVFEAGRPHGFEWTFNNGRTFRIHQYPHTDVDGSPLLLELGIDISEHKRAEEERAQLATAIEQATEGVLIIDRDETIRYANPAFESIAGCRRERIAGNPLGSIGEEYWDESFRKAIRTCLAQGDIWAGRFTGRKVSGTAFEVEASISPVRSESGVTMNCVVIERDVTNEAKLEKQLQQSRRMEALGTLAGGIAHDFNNILAIIFGYAEIALIRAPEGDPIRDRLEGILIAAHRAKGLVQQILAFSRQIEQKRCPMQIGPIVEETIKLIRASLPSNIEIWQDILSQNMVLTDPTQIHQILMNLCSNAAHAMRERGGVLAIGLFDAFLDNDFTSRHPTVHPGPYVRLSVSDTGHGMDSTTMERIFDPYFTTKGASEGTGLGLSVVHGIIRSHGGTITVYSEPGKRSSFSVFLPVFQKEVTGLEPLEGRPVRLVPRGNEHILFVDDEEILCVVRHETLEHLGYEVTTRTSGIEALELFRLHPNRFDLVITDLTMPHMSGLELAKEIRRIRPDVPVILCTGYSAMITHETAKAAGIWRTVAKPLNLEDLATLIRTVMEEKKSLKSSPT